MCKTFQQQVLLDAHLNASIIVFDYFVCEHKPARKRRCENIRRLLSHCSQQLGRYWVIARGEEGGNTAAVTHECLCVYVCVFNKAGTRRHGEGETLDWECLCSRCSFLGGSQSHSSGSERWLYLHRGVNPANPAIPPWSTVTHFTSPPSD